MSVRIMSQAWAVDLPAGEKLVLLALADCANDEGRCWPGIRSLCAKTGKSERSLQDALKALEVGGQITRDQVIGKGCNYTVHPQASLFDAPPQNLRPAKSAPPQKEAKTPAESAPKPSGTVRGIEANASTPKPWALPAGVSLQVWTDFLSNRKRKRLGNTPSAWKAFNDDLRRVSAQTGIPPPQLIEHAAAKGWGGIYDPNERNQRNERPDNPLAIAVQRLSAHH